MILKANEQQNGSESSSGKAELAAEDRRAALEVPPDAPPSYTTSTGPSRTTTSSHSLSHPPASTPAAKHTNFVFVDKRDGSIKENYTLNPTIIIPEALLPPLSENSGSSGNRLDPAVIISGALKKFPVLGSLGALGSLPGGLDLFQKNVEPTTRPNLFLQSQYGGIETELTIPHVDPQVFQGKMLLLLSAPHGTIKCRIRRPTTSPAFAFEATADHGYIKLVLPRSFHGPLFAKTSHGSVKLSDGISSNNTLFSEVQGEKRCFIGDTASYLDHARLGTQWGGDEVYISSEHGRMEIVYEDEFEDRSKKGFWSGLVDKWMS